MSDQTPGPDIYAEIAEAGTDPARLLALLARVAPIVEKAERRKLQARKRQAKYDVKRRQMTSDDVRRRQMTSENGDSAANRAAHITRGLAGELPVQEQEPEQVLGTANAVPLRDSLTLTSEPTRAGSRPPTPARKSRRRPRQGEEATEQTPAPVPTGWLDHLHRVWGEVAGVVNIPRFRKQVVPALQAGYTVGQIERAMRWWVDERQHFRRPVVLEYCLAELGATIRAVDLGGAIFALSAGDLGLSTEEQAARQAAYLAELVRADAEQMDTLRNTPRRPPVAPHAAPHADDSTTLRLRPSLTLA